MTLDDRTSVRNLDTSDLLGVIAAEPQQLKHAFSVVAGFRDVRNIVVAAMGGSALAAEFVKAWLRDRLKTPFEIVRDYALPATVDKDTLVIASSYSGNTEETLAAMEQAAERGCQIVAMAAGGTLRARAAERGYPVVLLPGGYQPRMTVLYGARALATVLERLELSAGLIGELERAADWVGARLGDWVLDSPTGRNRAKQIAQELHRFAVVVYGGPTLAMPAMKWKIDLNENSKNVAFWNQVPELNHNEFIGWLYPKDKALKVVELHSHLDHPRIAKRFAVSNELLAGQMPAPIIVRAEGETKLEQMLWGLLLGDFVSAYLAFLNGIDPTPVPLVEALKQKLG
jgi:glucose/mannose-6-phosphate isomerase